MTTTSVSPSHPVQDSHVVPGGGGGHRRDAFLSQTRHCQLEQGNLSSPSVLLLGKGSWRQRVR